MVGAIAILLLLILVQHVNWHQGLAHYKAGTRVSQMLCQSTWCGLCFKPVQWVAPAHWALAGPCICASASFLCMVQAPNLICTVQYIVGARVFNRAWVGARA
jgi:hypothetical protein